MSGPLPCPYLPGKAERKLFTRLTYDPTSNAAINARLTSAGFRRSHDIVYRPVCHACAGCVPVRIATERFTLSRALRRVANINRDLRAELWPRDTSDSLYSLFLTYQKARHPESDMARMPRNEFDAMLSDRLAPSVVLEVFTQESARTSEAFGAIILDRVEDGLSAVYSFFSPDLPRRSLGTYLVLKAVDEAKRLGLPFVYLGYWIAASGKMAYKARFDAIQALGADGWQDVRLCDYPQASGCRVDG